MVDGFPMILHERSAQGITIRAEIPVLEIEGVIALLCVECNGERFVSTTETDLSDQDVFNQNANRVIATWERYRNVQEPMPDGWYFAG